MSYKDRSKPKSSKARKKSTLFLKESFLIFCEGETEVGYFNSFRKKAKLVKGGNAIQRVENAISEKNKKQNINPIDHYWIVFDKDDATDQEFINAIHLAEKNGINVAWSNQAFELWIILHFTWLGHFCHRDEYETRIKQYLKWYSKNEKGDRQGKRLYNETSQKVAIAIANASKIFEVTSQTIPHLITHSSTTVYKLVESLIKL